ncbi:uncharacterized protein EV420DRAFT_1652608 [Desarmillaria tabescens]|uniref:Uncharacterized protein n=1 Tax=Armillaria tabescens TaxID=1929756 RepID=A0AA39MJM9_ARMTA|nr:uncharacterized protein EV420DRAFT_1652608 [Desarmillaria tabescens]KAK0436308.1 hypothetical protein EV420DRAFT_1652608 [Desarmillaria tabescens]
MSRSQQNKLQSFIPSSIVTAQSSGRTSELMTEPGLPAQLLTSRRITSLQAVPITHSVSSYQKMISQDLAAEAIPLANKRRRSAEDAGDVERINVNEASDGDARLLLNAKGKQPALAEGDSSCAGHIRTDILPQILREELLRTNLPQAQAQAPMQNKETRQMEGKIPQDDWKSQVAVLTMENQELELLEREGSKSRESAPVMEAPLLQSKGVCDHSPPLLTPENPLYGLPPTLQRLPTVPSHDIHLRNPPPTIATCWIPASQPDQAIPAQSPSERPMRQGNILYGAVSSPVQAVQDVKVAKLVRMVAALKQCVEEIEREQKRQEGCVNFYYRPKYGSWSPQQQEREGPDILSDDLSDDWA